MMGKVFPFKNIKKQRVISILTIIVAAFFVFYRPTFPVWTTSYFVMDNSIFGLIVALVGAFYLLMSFD